MNGIMKYINRIHRTGGVVYSSKLKDYGIAHCQHPYIILICREPGIVQEKISREICVNKKQCDPTACDTGRKRLDYPSTGYGRPQSLASIPHREDAGAASLCAERYAGMERVPAGRAE